MTEWDGRTVFVAHVLDAAGDAALSEYFSKYGEVERVKVAQDGTTGRPRGFAFVTFVDPVSAAAALKDEQEHVILGRKVELNKALKKNYHQQHQSPAQNNYGINSRWLHGDNGHPSNSNFDDKELSSRKVFVGGLPSNAVDDDLRRYFAVYGLIVDAVVIYDNFTRRPRGFGFVTFDSQEAVEKVVRNNFHELKGRRVEVKRAIPRNGSRGGPCDYNAGMSNGRGLSYAGYESAMYSPHGGIYLPHRAGYSPYPYDVGYPYGYGGHPYFMGPYAGLPYGGHPLSSPHNGYGMDHIMRAGYGMMDNPIPFNGPPYNGYSNRGVGGVMHGYDGASSSGLREQFGRNQNGQFGRNDQFGRNAQAVQPEVLQSSNSSRSEDCNVSDESAVND